MRTNIITYLLFILIGIAFSVCDSQAYVVSGKVLDAITGGPVPNALITLQETVVRSDSNGRFHIDGVGNIVSARAIGYLREEVTINLLKEGDIPDIRLKPFTPKALYLSFYGVSSNKIKGPILKLIDETELNALVIDVKGDKGMISFKSSIPLAGQIGAQKIRTIRDVKGLIDFLHSKGIYVIARIVTFKDELLAQARPDLAVKTEDGQIYYDREGLPWTDPFKSEVRDYNISIAEEAAQNGFDEIQFDYIRFPDTNGLKYSLPDNEETRVKAISELLSEARKRLIKYNVFLAADIFGYTFWNLNDTNIGQRIEDLAQQLDYLSPMLYPSGFHLGLPKYRNPVANTGAVIRLTLENGKTRTGLSSKSFRPWLQAFRDYAFDKRLFGDAEIREQIQSANDFGSNGWMLWNPRNVYSTDGLEKQD